MATWDFFASRLLELARAKKLPHLFLFEGDQESTKSWLQDEVLSKLYPNAANREQNSLILAPSGENYKLEDLQEDAWRSFFSHRPDVGDYRFIIFEKSEGLSDRVANRLLKDLEDTPAWLCIMMINSGAAKVLPTIKSRAIKWRLPTPKLSTAENEEFETWLKQIADSSRSKNYGALPDLMRQNEFDETKLMNKLHDVFIKTAESSGYTHCDKWLEHLRWWQKSAVFHQTKWERLLPFCVFSAAKLDS